MRLPLIIFLAVSVVSKAQTYGLTRLTDLCPGQCSGVSAIASDNGTVYFSGMGPTSNVGLWKSDGTPGGTVFIKETNNNFSTTYNYFSEGPVMTNGIYLFGAAPTGSTSYVLWRSDGTPGGTYVLNGPLNPTNIIQLNGFCVFIGSSAAYGFELWRSDGTQAGTYLVKDIKIGTGSSLIYLEYTGVLNNKLYFGADNGINGFEPWITDGTAAGTSMIIDLKAGPLDGDPVNFKAYHNAMYFGGNSSVYGGGTFKTDGTPFGTTKVLNYSWDQPPAILNDTLYFSTFISSAIGDELYKSTCSQSVITLVRDIFPGNGQSNPSFIENINGKLYFTANDGVYGKEIWTSDGTFAGTQIIKDINPGINDGAYTSTFTPANNKVYFNASDPVNGKEIWETDGTAQGTVVYDIRPGQYSSNPINFRAYNNELYIRADDGITGNELWKIGSLTAGINEFDYSENTLKVYPNPNSGCFIIDVDKEVLITVSDILGEVVLNQLLKQGKNNIELNNHVAGIYFINCGAATFKVLKQ